jgi:hypothetical protein
VEARRVSWDVCFKGSWWNAGVDAEKASVDAHDRAMLMGTKRDDEIILLVMIVDVKMDECDDNCRLKENGFWAHKDAAICKCANVCNISIMLLQRLCCAVQQIIVGACSVRWSVLEGATWVEVSWADVFCAVLSS